MQNLHPGPGSRGVCGEGEAGPEWEDASGMVRASAWPASCARNLWGEEARPHPLFISHGLGVILGVGGAGDTGYQPLSGLVSLAIPCTAVEMCVFVGCVCLSVCLHWV